MANDQPVDRDTGREPVVGNILRAGACIGLAIARDIQRALPAGGLLIKQTQPCQDCWTKGRCGLCGAARRCRQGADHANQCCLIGDFAPGHDQILVARPAPFKDGDAHRRAGRCKQYLAHGRTVEGRRQPIQLQAIFPLIHRPRYIKTKGQRLAAVRLRQCRARKKAQHDKQADHPAGPVPGVCSGRAPMTRTLNSRKSLRCIAFS